MTTPQEENTTAPAAQVKPLPEGYTWRVVVIISLFLGAGICMIFVSSILGAVLFLCALAFGKFSGIHDMEQEILETNADGGDVSKVEKM